MLQRFYRGTAILLPDIAFQDKDLFTYKWYVDDILVGEEYRVSFRFDETKKNVVKLVTTNKSDGLTSTSFKKLSIITGRNLPVRCYYLSMSMTNGGEGS